MQSALTDISFYSIFAPFFTGLFTFNKTGKLFKLFSCFIFITTLSESISSVLFNNNLSNTLILNFYILFETIGFLYILNLITNEIFKKFTLVTSLLFSFIYIFLFIKGNFKLGIDNHLVIFQSLLLVFTSLGALIYLLKKDQLDFQKPENLLLIAIVFYFSVCLIVFSSYELIVPSSKASISRSIWKIHSICNIITNLFFAFCIWLKYRQTNMLK